LTTFIKEFYDDDDDDDDELSMIPQLFPVANETIVLTVERTELHTRFGHRSIIGAHEFFFFLPI